MTTAELLEIEVCGIANGREWLLATDVHAVSSGTDRVWRFYDEGFVCHAQVSYRIERNRVTVKGYAGDCSVSYDDLPRLIAWLHDYLEAEA